MKTNDVMNLESLETELVEVTELLSLAKKIGAKLWNQKGPFYISSFLEICLMFGPIDLDNLFRIGKCFGFQDKNEIRFAAFGAVRSGDAKFDDQWRLTPSDQFIVDHEES